MQLKDIKRLYRLYMNGIVSHSMREKGAEYRVNFGLTLPLLMRIAEQVTPTVEIAEELWNDTGVRESMLLAPMLYPSQQFKIDDAHRWLNSMPGIEVSDFCCKYLFSQLDYAPALALESIHCQRDIEIYTGFRLGYSILENNAITPEWIDEMTRCAIATTQNTSNIASQSARRFLIEGLMSKKGAIMVETLQQTTNISDEWREQLMALYEPKP